MDFLINRNNRISVCIDASESDAVKIAKENLIADLQKTLNVQVCEGESAKIIIKTDGIGQKTEAFQLKVSNGCLYISGHDRRGTIYGIYTLCEMLGVSPWYYWADVPVRRKECFCLKEGYVFEDAPSIPYRGIFINDEEELDKWARLHMGESTISVNTYEKIFELILRLKGNYIWPAMHVNSFNMNVENGALAQKMGIVVGTSHCDMLMRSNNREWKPWLAKKGCESAEYDYSIEGRNREILQEYWRESVEQNKDFEVSYTLGMRGIHDSGFNTRAITASSDEELMDKKCVLLEQVINDQQNIIESVLGHDTMKTFVPYKEVLNLYDHGLKVPEDITLIWSNDNYGYIRRYPSAKDRSRIGGHGIYYHNSYWAASRRHYLFLSSIPIAKTYYELKKAYENGIQKLWVCNMGALKPLEQEMEYFLRLGWDFGKKNAVVNDAQEYLADWIDRNFSGRIGLRTAKLLNRYARVSDTRKVEFMEEDAFSQGPYFNEAAVRLNTLKAIYDEGNEIYEGLPREEQPAFFEMVLMKLHAAYYTAAMYYFADRSNLCVQKGRNYLANEYTRLCKGFEDLRRKLIKYYNFELCDGKWEGILTPEDFPPPRTAMHPACVPALTDNPVFEEDSQELLPCNAYAINATDGTLNKAEVIKHLGRGTVDMVEIGEDSSAVYEFKTVTDKPVTIEIHRYPSLNSVGSIHADVSVDENSFVTINSEATDEKRGNWFNNITDQVERMRATIADIKPGRHTLKLFNATQYFAFSKIVIYEGEIIDNNLGAMTGNIGDYASAKLPTADYYDTAGTIWYGNLKIDEYVAPVADFKSGFDVCAPSDAYVKSGSMSEAFAPKGTLTAGSLRDMGTLPATEKEAVIAIEAFAAYNNTENAYCTGPWEYCCGVSYERTNLAMYMRKHCVSFDEGKEPELNYKVKAEGGTYTVYLLNRFVTGKEAVFHLEIDGKPIASQWKNDNIWRYEGEQPYRYVPLAVLKLSEGEHLLTVKVPTGGARIERVLLINKRTGV